MMSLDDFLGKSYKHVKNSDNFDYYLKYIGVSFYARKLSKILPSSVSIRKLGKEYHYTLSIPMNSNTLKIVPGQATLHRHIDGRDILSHFTISGNVIKESQVQENGLKVYIERHFTDKHMKMLLKTDNIEAEMLYEVEN